MQLVDRIKIASLARKAGDTYGSNRGKGDLDNMCHTIEKQKAVNEAWIAYLRGRSMAHV